MLELSGLEKRYDGFEFGPIDLAVDEEVLAVLGPSGCGKTTLLSLVAGIVRPDAGSVSLHGRDLTGLPIEERRTGLVFQEGALFPHLTARENIQYGGDPDRVEELTSVLEITDVLDRRPPALSGGERQRVALARTLAAGPDALLLDEPLSSLDAPIRRRLRSELRSLVTSLDIPVVYVTHDQRTATALGDRLAIVRDGQLEQVGSPTEVRDRPATRFVASFTGTDNLFDATVYERDANTTWVRLGDISIRAEGPVSVASGDTVTVCIHPSSVRLRVGDPGDDSAENEMSGSITHWLNEGTEYRVSVDIDSAPITVIATLQPPAFDRLRTETGDAVELTIAPDAVHLIRSA